ncbi:hypothetical protein [Rhodopseudomonas palustris]|uniref:hypothetical protein n=1 Tax=Rhodopseudomonas palustris TaxID=1076 RepID=UPI00140361B5|nr:hypothetical protein [Rhodopseudomonas palustris]
MLADQEDSISLVPDVDRMSPWQPTTTQLATREATVRQIVCVALILAIAAVMARVLLTL